MATSPIFGAFGPLRKSIGSVTYSTLATARDGKRKQVARQKPTSVRNPNTVAQILQRMKLAPAQRFYDAFEKVVAKGIMSHSWEGVSYGNASRQEFMHRAMKNDAAVYVPKGYNALAPGEYEVSAGSLPSLPWRNQITEQPESGKLFSCVDSLGAAEVDRLLALGLQLGDQITCVFVQEGTGEEGTEGEYFAKVARCIVGVGNHFEGSAAGFEFYVYQNGCYVDDSKTAGAAVIISRGQEASSAKRSNEKMLLLGRYKNLISADAMNAAIASYESGVAVTSLGSDWFLNDSPLTGQAISGTTKVMQIEAEKEDGTKATRSFFVVERVSNGQVGYVVPTENGASDTPAYVQDDDKLRKTTWPAGEGAAEEILGREVARGLINAGLNSLGYVALTPAIAAQGGFTIAE